MGLHRHLPGRSGLGGRSAGGAVSRKAGGRRDRSGTCFAGPGLAEETMKTAIRNGEAAALRRLLAEDSSRANALIRWGKDDCIRTHPLHYVSDMLFEGVLLKGKEMPLIE